MAILNITSQEISCHKWTPRHMHKITVFRHRQDFPPNTVSLSLLQSDNSNNNNVVYCWSTTPTIVTPVSLFPSAPEKSLTGFAYIWCFQYQPQQWWTSSAVQEHLPLFQFDACRSIKHIHTHTKTREWLNYKTMHTEHTHTRKSARVAHNISNWNQR